MMLYCCLRWVGGAKTFKAAAHKTTTELYLSPSTPKISSKPSLTPLLEEVDAQEEETDSSVIALTETGPNVTHVEEDAWVPCEDDDDGDVPQLTTVAHHRRRVKCTQRVEGENHHHT